VDVIRPLQLATLQGREARDIFRSVDDDLNGSGRTRRGRWAGAGSCSAFGCR